MVIKKQLQPICKTTLNLIGIASAVMVAGIFSSCNLDMTEPKKKVPTQELISEIAHAHSVPAQDSSDIILPTDSQFEQTIAPPWCGSIHANSTTDSLKQRNQCIFGTKQDPKYTVILEGKRVTPQYTFRELSRILNISNILRYEQYGKKYFDSDCTKWRDGKTTEMNLELAKQIAAELTGRYVPPELAFALFNKDEYRQVETKIHFKETCYPYGFTKYLHEIGHAYALQKEDAKFFSLGVPVKREVKVMEEACAVAFFICGSNLAKEYVEKEVSEVIEMIYRLRLFFHIAEYSIGSTNPEDEAVAIVDATIFYMKDAGKAYNYLIKTDYEKLDPNIRRIMNENLKLLHTFLSD
jgi:hypothetical protein